MLLAFDTATHAVTVALHDGMSVVAESTTVDPLRQGELLAPGIGQVLSEAGVTAADLTRIVVGVGPGPFTGLRVGVVTAKTMAATLGIPVAGVCTLDVIAAAVQAPSPFTVATDARRKEVYWARYGSPTVRLTPPAVGRPADVATEGPVAGQGARIYPGAFPRAVEPEFPSAGVLARIAVGGDTQPLAAEPLYLRRPHVAAPGAPKRVS